MEMSPDELLVEVFHKNSSLMNLVKCALNEDLKIQISIFNMFFESLEYVRIILNFVFECGN